MIVVLFFYRLPYHVLDQSGENIKFYKIRSLKSEKKAECFLSQEWRSYEMEILNELTYKEISEITGQFDDGFHRVSLKNGVMHSDSNNIPALETAFSSFYIHNGVLKRRVYSNGEYSCVDENGKYHCEVGPAVKEMGRLWGYKYRWYIHGEEYVELATGKEIRIDDLCIDGKYYRKK
jgi:hypothetical protein